jgi:pheromone shutdown protein TraB
MSSLVYVKVAVGFGLFAAWMLLEYCPPKVSDVDSLKTFIKMTLGGLVGNLVTPGG